MLILKEFGPPYAGNVFDMMWFHDLLGFWVFRWNVPDSMELYKIASAIAFYVVGRRIIAGGVEGSRHRSV